MTKTNDAFILGQDAGDFDCKTQQGKPEIAKNKSGTMKKTSDIAPNMLPADYTPSDSEDFMKNFESMISGPQGLGEFLKKMGVDIHIKAAESEVTVDVDENLNQKEDDSIPVNDVFVQGNKMSITIDISNYDDIESENIELSLTGGGEVLQLLRINQIRLFRTYVLPHTCVHPPKCFVH